MRREHFVAVEDENSWFIAYNKLGNKTLVAYCKEIFDKEPVAVLQDDSLRGYFVKFKE
jgi:hypothetical protein